jgi:hypothetical protein
VHSVKERVNVLDRLSIPSDGGILRWGAWLGPSNPFPGRVVSRHKINLSIEEICSGLLGSRVIQSLIIPGPVG